MSRHIYLLLIGLILIAGALVGFLVLRTHWRGWRLGGICASSAPLARATKRWEPLLVPDVTLQISDNDGDEISVYQGTPLVFAVTIGNQRAISAVMQNRANDLY